MAACLMSNYPWEGLVAGLFPAPGRLFAICVSVHEGTRCKISALKNRKTNSKMEETAFKISKISSTKIFQTSKISSVKYPKYSEK